MKRTDQTQCARLDRKGMTLAELTVGMVMLSVIGLAVAGMTVSLSKAYAGGERFYSALQKARVSMLRIERQTRKARTILSDDQLTHAAVALWDEDTNDDGKVNLSEITLYWFQSGTGSLVRQTLVFPPANQALDYGLEPESLSNVNVVILLMWWFQPYQEEVELCDEVSECTFITDEPAPDANLLSIRLCVGADGRDVQLQSAVSVER